MRIKIVAGNWKMNKTFDETKTLIKEINKKIKFNRLKNTRVLIAPAIINLKMAVKKTAKSKIEVIAQNVHQAQNGAYTGEISAQMLQSIGVNTVIVGHSERRSYFGETNEILKQKVDRTLGLGMEIIFCFGENLEERNNNTYFEVIENQLKSVLFHLKNNAFKNIILAYEPVWAIGTGVSASATEAQEVHQFVRNLLAKTYNKKIADNISILYGGSVKPDNAQELFSQPDIDGGLIGGAALKAEDFYAIIKAI